MDARNSPRECTFPSDRAPVGLANPVTVPIFRSRDLQGGRVCEPYALECISIDSGEFILVELNVAGVVFLTELLERRLASRIDELKQAANVIEL